MERLGEDGPYNEYIPVIEEDFKQETCFGPELFEDPPSQNPTSDSEKGENEGILSHKSSEIPVEGLWRDPSEESSQIC